MVKIAKELLGKQSIKVLVEVGARDCRETLSFYKLLPNANIYTFECNPQTLPDCRAAVKNKPRINLIEKAVSNVTGIIKFYPINPSKTITTWANGNPGASSIFKASGKYPVEKYIQDEIEVESIRLEDFIKENSIDTIDLMWMDIQGAELLALKGLGDRIQQLKLVYLEIEFFEIYKDQPLYDDLRAFLNKKGFLLVGFTNIGKYSGDAIFVNGKYFDNYFKKLKCNILNQYTHLKYKAYRIVSFV
ncbi:FkbM family methyltransferase [Methanosarcina vacuolata]|uniref:FkbM family methyltransferase n=1 Tax=Methanosarcina vacuolata TaxID=2215 RepID=UPI0018DCF4D9|nr:FkbM family methyltransferase [Methanosarcina vacuolata]